MMLQNCKEAVLASAALLMMAGCGSVDKSGGDAGLTLLVSSLHYIKDANVTMEDNRSGSYLYRGQYYFSNEGNNSTQRMAVGGHYVTSEWDEDNTSVAPITCPQFDTNATMPVLKAPADDNGISEFLYYNVNPFTTLLIDDNRSYDELAIAYPIAYSINKDFNFDTALASYTHATSDQNLSEEVCDAIWRLLQLQQ